MKFCWSTVMVNNMEESIRFYQEVVGLSLCRRVQPQPGVEIAFFGDDSETQLELIYNEANNKVNIGQDISLGFEVKSVNEKMESLKRMGIAIHSGPYRPNPYVKFFYVMDPNGLKVQLVERM